MKASIVEITEWYNSKGKLIEHTIVYETGRKFGCFEQLPKTAEKWLERVKQSAECTEESKVGDWTKKVYRNETHKE